MKMSLGNLEIFGEEQERVVLMVPHPMNNQVINPFAYILSLCLKGFSALIWTFVFWVLVEVESLLIDAARVVKAFFLKSWLIEVTTKFSKRNWVNEEELLVCPKYDPLQSSYVLIFFTLVAFRSFPLCSRVSNSCSRSTCKCHSLLHLSFSDVLSLDSYGQLSKLDYRIGEFSSCPYHA